MDRITKSLLIDFSKEHQLIKIPEDKQFEHFAAFIAASNHYAETFDTVDLVVGKGNDTGIDAIVVLANGYLITEKEQIAELAETGVLDVSFIFIQAQRSINFDAQKIGNFGFGVQDFFSDSPKLKRNASINHYAEIMDEVFSNSNKFKRGNPTCLLYYITTGKFTGDTNLNARRKSVLEDLQKLNLFSKIEVELQGAEFIQSSYHRSQNAIEREIQFAERVVIPETKGVSEAYLGIVPVSEFIKLLDDGNGNILKSIFYDNVRDFQDYNPVNSEMKKSLEDGDQKSRFVLMNNGITVIAKKVQATGNKFLIEDYQIVNGCQTSHVLFDCRDVIDESVVVPLRIIGTNDEDVTASIIRATNKQTIIKDEQLLAFSEFQKRIEKFFVTFPEEEKLYYERRSKQYASTQGIEKTRVVTPQNLIRSFAAMFLGEPHRTTRDFRRLLDQVGTNIFAENHKLDAYYLAASTLYRLEFLFRNGLVDPAYKTARFQLLYAARLIMNNGEIPPLNSKDLEIFCAPMIKQVWDTDAGEQLFVKAVEVIDSVAKGNLDSDNVRTQPFTEAVRNALADKSS